MYKKRKKNYLLSLKKIQILFQYSCCMFLNLKKSFFNKDNFVGKKCLTQIDSYSEYIYPKEMFV